MDLGIELYLISPTVVLMAFETIVAIGIGIYLFQFRETPGTGYLSYMQFAIAVWAASYCLEFSATQAHLKILWAQVSYIGITFTPIFLYCFAFRFAMPQKQRVPRKRLLFLVLMAAFFIILTATNKYHHLTWKSFHIAPQINTSIFQYGIGFWAMFVFIYILLLISLFQIIQKIHKRPKKYHSSLALIVIATLFPVIGNILYVFKINPLPGFDWTSLTFIITGSLLAFMNIRYRTFNLLPFARKKLIDIIQDAVLFTDSQNYIEDINPAFIKMLNLPPNNIIGYKVDEIAFFKQRPDLCNFIQTTQQKNTKEIRIVIDNISDPHYYDMTNYPVYGASNQIRGKFILLTDITSKKRRNEKLTRANEKLSHEIIENRQLISALNSFAHTVAHDLKDPVGGIDSATSLLKLDLDQRNIESAEITTDLIQQTAQKTLKVIEELLKMSTLQDKEIKLGKINMNTIISDTLFRLHNSINEKNAQIKYPKDWPEIYSQAAWLEEVWVNFITNAIKYGGNPPIIELGYTAITTSNSIKFWIKDNGQGLTETEQNKLFKKYIRLEESKAEGTGLGLVIVKRIIERLGGHVGVESEPQKYPGSTFFFILPLNLPD